jgi:hypothetical protein
MHDLWRGTGSAQRGDGVLGSFSTFTPRRETALGERLPGPPAWAAFARRKKFSSRVGLSTRAPVVFEVV